MAGGNGTWKPIGLDLGQVRAGTAILPAQIIRSIHLRLSHSSLAGSGLKVNQRN